MMRIHLLVSAMLIAVTSASAAETGTYYTTN